MFMSNSNLELSRNPSIDQFRGFSILLMVLANYLAGIQIIPAWLKHTPDIGLTVIDLIAPSFIFVIGLTYGLSWKKRILIHGRLRTYQHFFTRFMAIIGIGAVLSAGEIWLQVDGATINWGVLQSIGAAGVLTLIVINMPTSWRAMISICLLAAYQYMVDTSWLASILQAPHGGLPGSISWGAMLILATVLADCFHDAAKRKFFFPISLLTLALGIGLAFIIPVSKNRVSFSYVLISLGISALIFFVMDWLEKQGNLHSVLFTAWGKNPLILYILHLLLLGIVFLPGIPEWYSNAPPYLIFLQIFGLTGILSGIAFWLEKKNILFSL
jgi:predicted acyltransferase